jgi:hypothetical protein
MNEIIETINESHTESEELFSFSNTDILLRTTHYPEYNVRAANSFTEKLITKKNKTKKASNHYEYSVIDYLIMYLILFSAIGIATVIFLSIP